jgi:hypothetical protein
MTFKETQSEMIKNIDKIFKTNTTLYTISVDKDELWNLYLDSFPQGTNEIYKTRREYDCQHCKQFVRGFGNVVYIDDDNNIGTIWDITPVFGDLIPVYKALSEYLKSKPVTNVFVTNEPSFGVKFNMGQTEDGDPIRYEHYYTKIPDSRINKSSSSNASIIGKNRANYDVLKRTFDEIGIDAIKTVIEISEQNLLYKGEEWLGKLKTLSELVVDYTKLTDDKKSNYAWRMSNIHGPAISRIRNHSIGTLLIDICKGITLNDAVRKYEVIVAPSNYMRPKPIYTESQRKNAQKLVADMGLTPSLRRRFSTIDDITVNNILFADRDSIARINNDDIFDELANGENVNPRKFDKVNEITIEDFIAKVLPTATKIEALLENRHKPNIVSLIAPVNADSKPLFKWGNNYSWAYAGNMTDSMKQNVKNAGGNIGGVLRFSLQWNEKAQNRNDMDAHCVEPSGNLISYPKAKRIQSTSGVLDVDIVSPGQKVAIENISYSRIDMMDEGIYKFRVHVFSSRNGENGFRCQIEFDNFIHDFDIQNSMRCDQFFEIGTVKYTKLDGFELVTSCNSTGISSSETCGLSTNTFHPVSLAMLSPNFWNDKTIGNKHYMFMLKDCINDETPNGFFNEFLPSELLQYKGLFAMIGDKMKVDKSDNQLSGLGFSSTKPNSLIVKVDGYTSRVMKIVF